jgi:hypothetical protein
MKYKLTVIETDNTVSYRATDWMSFESDLLSIECADIGHEYAFFVDGKQVNLKQALAFALQAREAFVANRAATKKQITIMIGASGCKNNFHKIWVKK